MIGRIALVGAAVLAAAATSASAQQTQTYAYDVHGRLTGINRTTTSMSQKTTYILDKADNRTSRAVTAPTSGLMNAPSAATQGQPPVETQAAPQGAESQYGQSEITPDDLSNRGGAK